MPNLDRRKLLHAGIALTVPIGYLSMMAGCQQSSEPPHKESDVESTNIGASDNSTVKNSEPETNGTMMQIQYLEIVTPEVDALCQQYSTIHGVTFGDPEMNLGNARTAKLDGGGMIGIRAPMRETEQPVVRPYMGVENLDDAVAGLKDSGAEIAIPRMEIPGFAAIAIFIQGGIECGLWQSLN